MAAVLVRREAADPARSRVAVLARTLTITAPRRLRAVPAGIGSFVLGVGLGLLTSTSLVAIQSSVPWNQRGVATASNMLMRILGNALGAALFGGLLNLMMARYIRREGLEGRVSLDSIQSLMGESAPSAALSPAVLDLLRAGLSQSLHVVFWAIAFLGVLTLIAAWRIPEMERASED